MRCQACGQDNPEGFSFCGSCGAPLEAAPTPVREERKIVTVLFADLVGFTSRAEKLDPEDVRALLGPYHARLREELERYGGTVEKFIGDAVMALFGAPVAHEDDPERAVRAALAIRDWVTEENELQVRIAVATGEALVNLGARPESGEGMASGDVVNTAARLQAAAPVNGILVGETTYRATRHAIDFETRDPVDAKGKAEPISVWQALQARAAQGVDMLRDLRTPLVGRERELEALQNSFARARQERTPQLVTLMGVPGIGKSRLVYELMQFVERDPELIRWRQGRSLPYGEGVSFRPIAEIVKAEAGILEDDPPEAAAAKLDDAAARVENDADWVKTHLRRLIGVEEGAAQSTDRRVEAFAAWRRFFETLADEGPVVLVFEDLHWADDGTLEFVDHLVDWASDIPLLVVGTARPELLERRPAWGGGKTNALTLALAPLTSEQTSRLIAALAEKPVLDADAQQELLARAEGNPLYAEQYVRMLLERGDHSDLPLPESVQGIIAARVDGLAAEEKSLLQNAAVLGKVFWRGAAAALGEIEPFAAEELFHGLERREFVQRSRRSSVTGETEYAFRHVLVRDVAYSQIPRRARVEKHRRAAAWIESLGRLDDHAEMVAHHHTSALAYARAAGLPTSELEREASVALGRAADRAAALGSLGAASALYEQLLELTAPDDPERPYVLFRSIRARHQDPDLDDALIEEARAGLLAAGDRSATAELEATVANVLWLRGDRASCFAALDRAVDLVSEETASPAKAYVLVRASRFAMTGGPGLVDRAIELGLDALQLGEQLGLDEIRSRALNNIGCARMHRGDPRGLDDLRLSIAIGAAANSLEEYQAVGNYASMLFMEGFLAESRELLRRLDGIEERFGLAGYERWRRAEEAEDLYHRGEWDAADAALRDWLAEAPRSPHYMEASTRAFRSRLLAARDDIDGAAAECARAVELALRIEDPQVLQPILAWSGLLALEKEGRREATDAFREVTRRWGSEYIGYGHGVIELAWLAAALGAGADVADRFARRPANRWASAALHVVRGELVDAADVLELVGSGPYHAYARLQAAEQLLTDGERSAADQQLARALDFYRHVGARRYVREAEALLAAAS